jgi:hypothetical protein
VAVLILMLGVGTATRSPSPALPAALLGNDRGANLGITQQAVSQSEARALARLRQMLLRQDFGEGTLNKGL